MHEIFQTISGIGVVPVIKIDDAAKAPALGKALLAGGIPLAEITFRTAAAEEAIRRMVAECPDLIVGAGTVINAALAKKAIAAGARFIVSPGFNPATVDYCLEQGVPVLPGATTPSLIEAGLEKGLEVFKFFPAEASGGIAMINALTAPFGGITFVPTGGIGPENLADYAKNDAVLAVGGSWMVKSDLINAEKWATITDLCAEAVTGVQGFSFAHLGINQQDAAEAAATASVLGKLGLAVREGSKSFFAGSSFEVMKSPFRGRQGHIALKCYNLERALTYLGRWGFTGVPETATTEKGRLKVIYLDQEIGGFAVHLLRD